MKSHRKVLILPVPECMGMVHIIHQVETAALENGIQEGFCLVNSMHITSSGRHEAARNRPWRRACDRWRADHGFRIRPSVYRTVPRTVLPIASLSETEPREQIFHGEFDGRRDKRVLIKIIGEKP